MMVPIKIQCECGQRYAFDVETDGDLPPGTVVCPACGVDGTNAANAIIAQKLAAEPAVATEPVVRPRIRITTPPAAARATAAGASSALAARPGAGALGVAQDDRNKAEFEARAKILWGDSREEVIKFLMVRGFSHQEASDKVRVMFKERLAAIRANGIGKILAGIVVAFGSAGFFLLQVKSGFISIWLVTATGVACVSGLWLLLDGLIKVLAPRSQGGDAADND